jgi:acyl-CoA thioesterase-1
MYAGSGRALTRRKWWLHCSATVAALAGLRAQALAATPAATGSAQARATGAGSRTLLVLGDSLSAEYGIARGSGWVALLERQLERDRIAARVVNASVSGDTTSGGRSRLPALLQQYRPTHVVIELGGNDALRGLPLSMTRDNLVAMTRAARAASARVLLVGMQMPPNYGSRYTQDFAALFSGVARSEGAALVPFLLAGVADSPCAEQLFQQDRIHPTAEAHPVILGNIWPVLRPWLTRG